MIQATTGDAPLEVLLGDMAHIELFAVFVETTDTWPGPEPKIAETLREHLVYLGKLVAQGKLLTGGALDVDPNRSGAGGRAILTIHAADRDEVECLLEEDPFVRAGWFTYTTHTLEVNFGCMVEPLRALLATDGNLPAPTEIENAPSGGSEHRARNSALGALGEERI